MNILKKSATFLFIGIIAIFSGRILSGQANRITLDVIIADIPERWWEGGWDKVIELNQFINQNTFDKTSCARAQYWIGCNYYANRDYERAIEEYETVLRLYSDAWLICAKSRFEIGQIYLYKLNDYESALESYAMVIGDYPVCEVTAQAQKSIAYIYRLLRDYERSHKEYEKVWQLYPEYKLEAAKAFYENGELYFKESFKYSREENLRKALSNYKLAYLYCPLEEEEVSEWVIESIIRAFKFLDGNMERANAFIRYQRYKRVNDGGKISIRDKGIYDPLKDF